MHCLTLLKEFEGQKHFKNAGHKAQQISKRRTTPCYPLQVSRSVVWNLMTWSVLAWGPLASFINHASGFYRKGKAESQGKKSSTNRFVDCSCNQLHFGVLPLLIIIFSNNEGWVFFRAVWGVLTHSIVAANFCRLFPLKFDFSSEDGSYLQRNKR